MVSPYELGYLDRVGEDARVLQVLKVFTPQVIMRKVALTPRKRALRPRRYSLVCE